MTTPLLECVEIEPPAPARSSVIWLHGLGADGHDFEPIVPHLGLDPDLRTRFVFPHAPSLPVTINAGYVMPAWYDIIDLSLEREVDERGIRASAERISALIAREIERGIPSNCIVLAGFSQGGAIALHVALRHPKPLAGVIALSTYLVLDRALAPERSGANLRIPIFQAHGEHDPMVPIEAGMIARDCLLQLGYALEWHTYPIAHEVNAEEIADVGAAIDRYLGPALAR